MNEKCISCILDLTDVAFQQDRGACDLRVHRGVLTTSPPPRIINSGACTPEYLCIAAGDVDHTRVYTRVHPEYMPWYIQITYPGIYRVHTYVPWYDKIQHRGINWSIAGF